MTDFYALTSQSYVFAVLPVGDEGVKQWEGHIKVSGTMAHLDLNLIYA